MELDSFVARHRPEWDRLEVLATRRRRLSGAEADELVDLYQRTATHLSIVQSSAAAPRGPTSRTSSAARSRSRSGGRGGGG